MSSTVVTAIAGTRLYDKYAKLWVISILSGLIDLKYRLINREVSIETGKTNIEDMIDKLRFISCSILLIFTLYSKFSN